MASSCSKAVQVFRKAEWDFTRVISAAWRFIVVQQRHPMSSLIGAPLLRSTLEKRSTTRAMYDVKDILT
jgi:hypothetical protein